MKTYQDLLECGQDEELRNNFCLAAIADHMNGVKYRTAYDAERYYQNENPTIMRLQKFVRNAMGQSVPDNFSPNNKIPSNLYHYFITQEIQTLLGNGAVFGKGDTTKDVLGGKEFDHKLQQLATYAVNDGCGFGFWNVDHLEVFSLTEFVPLYDEYTGELKAGIRFWQIEPTKPLCILLFELDGVTELLREDGKGIYTKTAKRAYIANMGQFSNYGDRLPIIPLYNEGKQSAIVGKQNTLDAYDLTLSQMVNNVDDGNFIYWILKNCGGMDAADDERFLSQLKITHMAHADGDSGAGVEAHTVEAPYAANEVTLEKLRTQLFDDFMALDTKAIAGGAVTATQILAAYEPLNSKCDQLEYNVIEFIDGLLELVGVEDDVSFTRSKIVNASDEIQSLVAAADYLDEQYITQKVLNVMGDGDQFTEVMARIISDDMERFEGVNEDVNGESGAQDS